MSKRLLFVLLCAAVAAATLVGFTVPATPANAELRTVTVRLADGSLTTVTVDVPPGTPLDQIDIPPVPTVPTPVPVPTPTPTPPPAGGGGSGDQPSDQPAPDDQAPTASKKGKDQKTSS